VAPARASRAQPGQGGVAPPSAEDAVAAGR
jgi:hypothetical protein